MKLLFILFGIMPKNTKPKHITTFNSVYPQEQLSFQDWVKEYNVSMLWDRKAIKLD